MKEKEEIVILDANLYGIGVGGGDAVWKKENVAEGEDIVILIVNL
jgi:hypothetical protein